MSFKIGIESYNWFPYYGGNATFEQQIKDTLKAGFEGIGGISLSSPSDLVRKCSLLASNNLSWANVGGHTFEESILYTAATRSDFVGISNPGKDKYDVESFAKMAEKWVSQAAIYGVRVAIHNHMGNLIESQEEIERFLTLAPEVGLQLDTGHLAGAGGDNIEIVKKYGKRILGMHLKDYLLEDKEAESWIQRGRFPELGKGNVGLDFKEILQALEKAGFNGWVVYEQDTTLSTPLQSAIESREFLRGIGY